MSYQSGLQGLSCASVLVSTRPRKCFPESILHLRLFSRLSLPGVLPYTRSFHDSTLDDESMLLNRIYVSDSVFLLLINIEVVLRHGTLLVSGCDDLCTHQYRQTTWCCFGVDSLSILASLQAAQGVQSAIGGTSRDDSFHMMT